MFASNLTGPSGRMSSSGMLASCRTGVQRIHTLHTLTARTARRSVSQQRSRQLLLLLPAQHPHCTEAWVQLNLLA